MVRDSRTHLANSFFRLCGSMNRLNVNRLCARAIVWQETFPMPDGFKTIAHRPADCPELHQAFCDCVNFAGEVDPLTLNRLRERGIQLAFVYQGDDLIAVAGLKTPRKKYFHDAGASDQADSYPAEFGWVHAKKTGGMTTRLTNALFDTPEGRKPLYATVRTGNKYMINPLRKLGFVELGSTFPSVEHPGEQVQLFVRAALPNT
jgi:hypothetical protein